MPEQIRFDRFEIPDDPEIEAAWAAARAAGSDAIVDFFPGCLTHLYPSHEDTIPFIEEERASWEELDRRIDERLGDAEG